MKSSQTALITGASSGIGLELARLFAADHYALILIALDEDKLSHAAAELEREYSASVTVLAHDLSLPDSADKIFEALKQAKIEVSVLVNNAGFGDYGLFHESDWEKQEQMIAVNITALTKLTRLFLPGMLERKNGKILNVASTAAFFPGPLMSVYFATKAYVLSFSHALANEVEGQGVVVSCLCPGLTKTDFQDRAAMHRSRAMQTAMTDVRTVAKIGYDGLMDGRAFTVPGRWNRVFIQMPRLFSRKHLAKIIHRAQSPS